MAKPDACDPCSCIPGTWNKDAFMQAVLAVLCKILTAASGGSPVAVTMLAKVVKQYTFFTNSFQALGFVDGTKKIGFARFINSTDAYIDISVAYIDISVDNSTIEVTVPPGGEIIWAFAQSGGQLTVATDIYAKYEQAPSRGTFTADGWHV